MRLSGSNLAVKASLTGFAVLLACSLVASALLLRQVTLPAGTDRAWPTAEDVRVKFGASPLERAIHGTMGVHLPPGRERETVIRWLRDGGERTGYYERVEPVLSRHCASCHGASASAAGAVTLTHYLHAEPHATGRGPTVRELLRFSHTHLFGIGIQLLALGILISLTRFGRLLRVTLAAVPPLALAIDCGSWWVIRSWPAAATIGWWAGVALFAGAGLSLVLVVCDLWLPAPSGQRAGTDRAPAAGAASKE